MISDAIILPSRLQRCLNAIERVNGRTARASYLIDAMYPPPSDQPSDFPNLLKVTIFELRKKLQEAGVAYRIDNVRGQGYRLVAVERT